MTDATILIPTYRHPRLLPYAVQSALDQEGASIELFVVGDGVEDDSREALQPFLADPRVRFFDFPKGPRHGELNRHEALREASGTIVCYLSDDDLLLRDHAAEMGRLLEDATFAHVIQAYIHPDGHLDYFPWDYGRAEFVEIARARKGSIGITGTSHRLDAYRRLPFGWRTTPEGTPTDHHMWLQWLESPDFKGALGTRLTHLWFPDRYWVTVPVEQREAALADWFRRSREPGFAEEAHELLHDALRRGAEDYHLWARSEQLTVAAMRRSRAWRAREWLLRRRLPRALRARRSGAR